MLPSPGRSTLLAAVLGGTGVLLGAFGAHALKPTLLAHDTLSSWQTAVLYQLVHAMALLAAAGWRDAGGGPLRFLRAIAWCWAAGTACFSGSLYLLALHGPRWLGPLTPLARIFHTLLVFFRAFADVWAAGFRTRAGHAGLKQNRQAVFHLARMPIRLQKLTREDQIIRNLFLPLARIHRRLRLPDESPNTLWLRWRARHEISGLGGLAFVAGWVLILASVWPRSPA